MIKAVQTTVAIALLAFWAGSLKMWIRTGKWTCRNYLKTLFHSSHSLTCCTTSFSTFGRIYYLALFATSYFTLDSIIWRWLKSPFLYYTAISGAVSNVLLYLGPYFMALLPFRYSVIPCCNARNDFFFVFINDPCCAELHSLSNGADQRRKVRFVPWSQSSAS